MRKYIGLLLIALIMSFAISVYAGTDEKAGTCVGQFLKIGAGARACGMGEAFSAVADDINAISWNPAGLMQIKGKEATFTHNEWLYDLKYEFLAYCQPTKRGVLGFSLTYLSMGEMEGKDKDDNPIGNFDAYDNALSIAYAVVANEKVYAGINGKFIHQKIESEDANGVAIDIGVLYHDPANEKFKASWVLQNLGSSLKFVQKSEELPLTNKFGLSYIMNKLILAGDVTMPKDNKTRLNLGVEYLHTPVLTFRVGYNSQNDLDSGLTLGIGFALKPIQIDYAFIPYGELDNSHRFSLTKRF